MKKPPRLVSTQGVPEWMRPHLLAGFGQASTAGPLCEESSVEQGGALPWVAVGQKREMIAGGFWCAENEENWMSL